MNFSAPGNEGNYICIRFTETCTNYKIFNRITIMFSFIVLAFGDAE